MRNLLLGLLSILLIVTSCTNDQLEEINRSPNAPTGASLDLIMDATLVGAIQPFEGENARLAGIWAQQFTGTDRQYAAFQTYNVSSADFDWAGYYYSTTNQADIAIEKATVDANEIAKGMMLTIKGMSFGTVAALWENAPYTQANNLNEFPNPSFDDQQTIYTGAHSILDDAIAAFETGAGSDLGTDFYFGGDPAKWEAAAHTLKARFYLHQGDYSSALSEAEQGILVAANDMMIPHPTGSYNQDMNLYHSFIVLDREDYMGAQNAMLPTMLDSVGEDADGVITGAKNNAKTDEKARFQFYYTGYGTVDGDGFVERGDYLPNTSAAYAATASFPLVTALENLLIAAECQIELGSETEALNYLNQARAQLALQFPDGTYEGYVDTDFDAGGIVDHGKGSRIENMRYEIAIEKYASLVGQIEVFNDLRRTKNLIGLTPIGTSTQLPQRYLVPQDEVDGNPNAVVEPDLFKPTAANL